MKKIFLLLVIIAAINFGANAQKVAYVNTTYILDNIPDYSDAQSQLDDFSIQWQQEIEKKFAEIDKMYKSYQKESVLLPADMKQKREDEIIRKEKEAKELQKKRFGQDGDLFKKRNELIKPLQERVYAAIEEVAKDEKYDIVLDKAGNANIIYSNPKYDISERILDNLGYTYKKQ